MSTSSQISRMASKYDRDPMIWEVREMTIRDFLEMLPDIDTLPIHQRIDVVSYKLDNPDSKIATKRQAIVSSIFKGVDIGEIKINERNPQERAKFGQKYESIDGGHRKRTILGFRHSEFSTCQNELPHIGFKNYSLLSEKERELFLSFKIRLIVYKTLTPSQKGMLWATANNFTALNHQEQCNGVGDTPLANFIRNLARGDKNNGIMPHDLFKLDKGKKGDVIGAKLTVPPNRLTYDRLVARIATVIYNGSKPCNVDDIDIEQMYFDATITQDRADAMEKKVVEVLDFILKMANFKLDDIGTKLTIEECIMLYRLWFSYQEDYESFKINKMWDYYSMFRKAWIRFHKDTDDDYALELIDAYDNKKEKRNRFAMFKENIGKGGVDRWLDGIEWIENLYLSRKSLIDRGIITVKESRKTLSKDLREQILHSQKDVCYIDGKPLKFKDAHAAHIVPLDEGGSNDRRNIRMVRAEHNTRMGTMHLEDYKKNWKKQTKAA